MSTPTDLHGKPGVLLTHPAFDRPPVHNERRPGPKKGTHSLAKVRREIVGERLRAELAAQREAPGMGVNPLPNAAAPTPADPWKSRAICMPPRDPLATHRPRHEDAVIGAALAIIEARMRVQSAPYADPATVKSYLRLQLADLDREVFGVMFLDSQHRLIAFEVMFEGTLSHTSVHPREVARRALQLNSGAVILAHNHPSGASDPSKGDEILTAHLRQTLALFEVRVLDHVIVCGNAGATSFAERGLL